MCARFARSVLLHLVNVGGFGDCIPAGMLAGLVRLVFLWSVPQFSPPPFRGGFCGAQYAVRLQQRDWILEIGLGEEEWTATVGEGGGAFGREASFVGGGIVVVEGCVDRMPPLPTGSPPLSIFLPCLDALCVYAEITRYDPQLPCPICRRRPEY